LCFTKCLQLLQVRNTDMVQCPQVTGRVTFYSWFFWLWLLCQILKYLNKGKLGNVYTLQNCLRKCYTLHNRLKGSRRKERTGWIDTIKVLDILSLAVTCIFKNLVFPLNFSCPVHGHHLNFLNCVKMQSIIKKSC